MLNPARALAVLALTAGTAASLAMPVAAGAAAPIDNANASVTCTSVVKAVLKTKPALTTAGGLPTVILLSGKLGGCTSPDGITFQEGKSSFRAVIQSADNACAGLAGTNLTSGSITIRWKTNEPVTEPVSTVTIPAGAIVGGAGTVAGALRVTFDLGTGAPSNGAGAGALPLAVSGGFTGGDGGAGSGATVVTELSVASVLALCEGKKGLQEVRVGAGALALD